MQTHGLFMSSNLHWCISPYFLPIFTSGSESHSVHLHVEHIAQLEWEHIPNTDKTVSLDLASRIPPGDTLVFAAGQFACSRCTDQYCTSARSVAYF